MFTLSNEEIVHWLNDDIQMQQKFSNIDEINNQFKDFYAYEELFYKLNIIQLNEPFLPYKFIINDIQSNYNNTMAILRHKLNSQVKFAQEKCEHIKLLKYIKKKLEKNLKENYFIEGKESKSQYGKSNMQHMMQVVSNSFKNKSQSLVDEFYKTEHYSQRKEKLFPKKVKKIEDEMERFHFIKFEHEQKVKNLMSKFEKQRTQNFKHIREIRLNQLKKVHEYIKMKDDLQRQNWKKNQKVKADRLILFQKIQNSKTTKLKSEIIDEREDELKTFKENIDYFEENCQRLGIELKHEPKDDKPKNLKDKHQSKEDGAKKQQEQSQSQKDGAKKQQEQSQSQKDRAKIQQEQSQSQKDGVKKQQEQSQSKIDIANKYPELSKEEKAQFNSAIITKIQDKKEVQEFARKQREKRKRKQNVDQIQAQILVDQKKTNENMMNDHYKIMEIEQNNAENLYQKKHKLQMIFNNRKKSTINQQQKQQEYFEQNSIKVKKQQQIEEVKRKEAFKEIKKQYRVDNLNAKIEKREINKKLMLEILLQALEITEDCNNEIVKRGGEMQIEAPQWRNYTELFIDNKPVKKEKVDKIAEASGQFQLQKSFPTKSLLEAYLQLQFKNFLLLKEDWEASAPENQNLNNFALGDFLFSITDLLYPITPKLQEIDTYPKYLPLKLSIVGPEFSGKQTTLKFLKEKYNIEIINPQQILQEALQLVCPIEEVQSKKKGQATTAGQQKQKGASQQQQLIAESQSIYQEKMKKLGQLVKEYIDNHFNKQVKAQLDDDKYSEPHQSQKSISSKTGKALSKKEQTNLKQSQLEGNQLHEYAKKIEFEDYLLVEAIMIKLESNFQESEKLNKDNTLLAEELNRAKEMEKQKIELIKKQNEDELEVEKKKNKKGGKETQVKKKQSQDNISDEEAYLEIVKNKTHYFTKGFAIYGFPQNLEQAELLEKALSGYIQISKRLNKKAEEIKYQISVMVDQSEIKQSQELCQGGLDIIINLNVPKDECLRRAQGRKYDPTTDQIYHLEDNPPSTDVKGLIDRLQDIHDERANEQYISTSVEKHLAKFKEVQEFYKLFGVDEIKFQQIQNISHNVKDKKFENIKKLDRIISKLLDYKHQKYDQLIDWFSQNNEQEEKQNFEQEIDQDQLSQQVVIKQEEQCIRIEGENLSIKDLTKGQLEILINQWKSIQQYYSQELKQIFLKLFQVRDSFITGSIEIQKRFCDIIKKPDDKFARILKFQESYNLFREENNEISKDKIAKNEMVKHLDKLYESIWDNIDSKKREAVKEREQIFKSNFIYAEIEKIYALFYKIFQGEVNKIMEISLFTKNVTNLLMNKPMQGNLDYVAIQDCLLDCIDDCEPTSFPKVDQLIKSTLIAIDECYKQIFLKQPPKDNSILTQSSSLFGIKQISEEQQKQLQTIAKNEINLAKQFYIF